MDDYWAAVVWTLLPTLVVSAIFYFVLRSIIRADRNERREYAKIEAVERAKLGLPPAAAPASTPAASAEGGPTRPEAPRDAPAVGTGSSAPGR